MSKIKKGHVQIGLFHQDEVFTKCTDIDNLPLITDPSGRFEVLAPGSIYHPVLLTPDQKDVFVGPGTLDKHEEKFVRDLIGYLYPKGDHPKSPKTPLKWGEKDIWLKRNIEKAPSSFRLRIDESDWFYPDFILWVLDHKAKIQTLGFVDPKGLGIGAAGGWSDYKILSTIYIPHVVERQLLQNRLPVDQDGNEWQFRVRGVIVSTSPFDALKEHNKFSLNTETFKRTCPEKADFERARIVFQKGVPAAYIPKVLELLWDDNMVDRLMKRAAEVRELGETFSPSHETDYDLVLRNSAKKQTDSEYISALMYDYLKLDALGSFGRVASERCRFELMKSAKTGRFGFGGEKASHISEHATPCEALWKRMKEIRGK
jgi:hypothetical protein